MGRRIMLGGVCWLRLWRLGWRGVLGVGIGLRLVPRGIWGMMMRIVCGGRGRSIGRVIGRRLVVVCG